MGVDKFLDLLRTRELYLARLDQFDDEFEGLWSQGNMHRKSKSWAAYTAAYPIVSDPVQCALQQFPMRLRYFATCWHINWREERAMWQCYTRRSDSESVVVVTQAGVLQRYGMARGGVCGMVKYVGREDPIPEYLAYAPAFYKHLMYRYEREFRVAVPWPNMHSQPTSFRRMSINPMQLIKAVIVHPHAQRGLGEFVLDR